MPEWLSGAVTRVQLLAQRERSRHRSEPYASSPNNDRLNRRRSDGRFDAGTRIWKAAPVITYLDPRSAPSAPVDPYVARFTPPPAGEPLRIGLMANGFPNMFMIAQPGSPSIRSQVLVSIEQHVDWVFEMLEHARKSEVVEIQASRAAEDAWTTHVSDVAMKSLFARADTQYVGANIPGKPRVYLAYLGGVGVYRTTCNTVRDHAYEGFVLKTETGTLPGSETWSGANEIPLVWGTAV